MEQLFDNEQNKTVLGLDDIEAMMKQPTQRQDYYEQPQQPQEPQEPQEPQPQPRTPHDGHVPIDSSLSDPDGTAADDAPADTDYNDGTDFGVAAANTGEMIARIADNGVSAILSNFVAKNKKEYKATPEQMSQLSNAWAQVAERQDWKLSPETYLVLLYFLFYMPLVREAIADRKLQELQSRQDKLEADVAELKKVKND